MSQQGCRRGRSGRSLSRPASCALALAGFRACVVGDAPEIRHAAPAVPAKYALTVVGGSELIRLRGELEAGVTRAVAAMLVEHPDARGVILDSGGGQIYEGRGLARASAFTNTHRTRFCRHSTSPPSKQKTAPCSKPKASRTTSSTKSSPPARRTCGCRRSISCSRPAPRTASTLPSARRRAP